MRKTIDTRPRAIALAAGIAVLAFTGSAAADHYVISAQVSSEVGANLPLQPSSSLTFDIAFDRVMDANGLNTRRYDPTITLTWTENGGVVHQLDQLAGNLSISAGPNGTGTQVSITGDTTNGAGHTLRFGIFFVTAESVVNIPTLRFGGNAGVGGTCFDLEPGGGNSDFVVRTITNKDDGGGGGATGANLADLIGTTTGGTSNNGVAGLVLAAQQSLNALSTANLDAAVSTRSTPGDVTAAQNVVTGAIAGSQGVVTNAITASQNVVTGAIAAAQNSGAATLATILGGVNLKIQIEIETALANQTPFTIVLGRDNIALVETTVGSFLTSIGVSLTDPTQDTSQTAVNATNYYRAGVAALAQPSPSYKSAWTNFGQAYATGLKLVR